MQNNLSKNIDNYLINNNWSDSNDIIKYFKQQNYIKLGHGFYSETWSNNKHVVYKLNNKYFDKSYLQYLYFISKNNNTHYPIIYEMCEYNKFYMVCIEKLYKCTDITLIDNLAIYSKLYYNKNSSIGINEFESNTLKNIKNNYYNVTNALDICIKHVIVNNIKCIIDIKPNNIMVRYDGTIVLADILG